MNKKTHNYPPCCHLWNGAIVENPDEELEKKLNKYIHSKRWRYDKSNFWM